MSKIIQGGKMEGIKRFSKWTRQIFMHLPRLKKLLKSVYYFLRRETPIPSSGITKELIRDCVGKDNPTILEIGCNDGTNTLWFLEIFKNPKVYCFEPDPRASARFKRKVGQHASVNLFEIALSNRNGEIVFHQSGGSFGGMTEGWDQSGSIRKPKDHLTVHPTVTFDQTITVKTATLDAWCSENRIEHIDFIWMDVQGAEIDVFNGGINALAKTDFIYTEYNNRELYEGQFTLKQLLERLRDFKVLIRYSDDVLLVRKQFKFLPKKMTT